LLINHHPQISVYNFLRIGFYLIRNLGKLDVWTQVLYSIQINISYVLAFIFLLNLSYHAGNAQGLYVNEVSNGPSGYQEYIELVVTGPPCTEVDITGYLLDDNNGADNASCEGFSTSTSTGMGIASGHYRFANIPRWQAVPTGSIILVYHDDEKNGAIPADDPDDTSPHDSVYILSTTDNGLDGCTDNPDGWAGDCSYTCSGYDNPPTSASLAGLRNSGDAAQVRNPDGSYLHGICYGSDMTGGPDDLIISTSSGSGTVYYFNDNNYRDTSNWSVGTAGTADETPGDYNNAANEDFIDSIRGNCPLPVELLRFNAENMQGQVELSWETATERNNDFFRLQHSADGEHFQMITRVPGAGQSTTPQQYQHFHKNPVTGANYYRLQQVDFNGSIAYSPVRVVNVSASTSQPLLLLQNPVHNQLRFMFQTPKQHHYTFQIFDATGRIHVQLTKKLDNGVHRSSLNLSDLPPGLYLLRIAHPDKTYTQKFIKSRP
jgi:hypothetical protein